MQIGNVLKWKSKNLQVDEIQIKTTIKYQFTYNLTKVQKAWWYSSTNGSVARCGTPLPCQWEYRLMQPFWRATWWYLGKLNMCILDKQQFCFILEKILIQVHMRACVNFFVFLQCYLWREKLEAASGYLDAYHWDSEWLKCCGCTL